MHVLIVMHNLEIGGAERQALRLSQGLIAAGERVSVASMRGGGALMEDFCHCKAHVLTDVIAHRFDLRGIWQLADYIDSGDVDVVISVDIIGDVMFYSFLSARLARRRPAAIGWVHNTPEIGYRPLEFINRMLSRNLDLAVAVSRSTRAAHVRRRLIPESRWSVVINSFDAKQYQSQLSQAAARQRFGLPQEGLLVGMVGNFYAHKDQPLLLQAVAEVLSRGRVACHLAFAGDGDKLHDCKRLAGELGIQNQVHFLGRIGEIPDLLRALDVFALASHHEGYNLAVMEAMAAGLPVVASDLPPLREGLKAGLLVSPHDLTALADTLEELLERPNLRRVLGLAGQQYVCELDSKSMVRRFHRLLRFVVQHHDGVPVEVRNA